MATPTVEEVLNGESQGTTVTLTTAGATATGDLLIAVQLSNFYDVANLSAPTPGSWTTIVTADLGVNSLHLRAWWRVAGSGGATDATFSPINDEEVGAYLYRLRAADPAAPIDASAAHNGTTAGTDHVAGSVSPATADALLVCVWGTGNGSYVGTPGGMTARTIIDGDPFFEMVAADQALAASGATGTRTATFSAVRQWVALSIAVQGANFGVTGSLAVTEQGDALAASGTAVPPAISGTIAVTEAADTLAAAGTVGSGAVTGTLAVTEAPDVLAAAGITTGAVDITVAVGPTRLRAAATAGATRDRTQAGAGETRTGWVAGGTRVGWEVGETIVDREA